MTLILRESPDSELDVVFSIVVVEFLAKLLGEHLESWLMELIDSIRLPSISKSSGLEL